MTTRERTSPQIRPYLDVLETRLGNLAAEERNDLLTDLEGHLEEILADDSYEPLADRIGSPDTYAAEFVASVGIADGALGDRSLIGTISEAVHHMAKRIESSRAQNFWEEMRPTWWTTRGLAIGLVLTWNYLGPGNPGALWFMQIVSGVTLIGFVWASMRLGRNRMRTNAWKWLSIGVTVFGVFAVFALSANISTRLDPYTYESGPYPIHVQEFYPFDSLTEQDFLFMSEAGMTPEEYFDSGYYLDVHEEGSDPDSPPQIILP